MRRALFTICSTVFVATLSAQSTYQQVVATTVHGNKVYLEINAAHLQQSIDSLFAGMGQSQSTASSLDWNDVLTNGANPGMDVNFNSYNIHNAGQIATTGTLTGDSLILQKDGAVTGSFNVMNLLTVGDSVIVQGFVAFHDSLEVSRAVAIGETLMVTGVTTLGDSVHVAGNVDLDALFNVDGAATFGNTLTVQGAAFFEDTLHARSAALLDDSLRIGGHARLLQDLWVDGNTNIGGALNVTGSTELGGPLNVDGVASFGDSLLASSPAVFSDTAIFEGGTHITGGLNVDQLLVNGVEMTALEDTDDLTEGATNLYYTDARARAAISEGTGVTIAGGQISIGQPVGTSDDLTIDDLAADSIAVTGNLTVQGVAALADSLVLGGAARMMSNLDVAGWAAVGDSLRVSGVVEFGDSLYIAGAGAIDGDFHLAGTASLESTLHVNGEASFSDTLRSGSAALLGDSLHVMGNTRLAQDLWVDGNTNIGGSVYVNGSTNLGGPLNVTGVASFGDSLVASGPAVFSDTAVFAGGAHITGGLRLDELLLNGVEMPAMDDTDDLQEGATNLYYTDARAQAAISAGTGVSITDGVISIGQAVGTSDDLTIDDLAVDSIAATGSLAVQGESTFSDSVEISGGLVVNDTNLLAFIADLQARIEALEACACPESAFVCGQSSVTYDGYLYYTTEIGSQCWFTQDLRNDSYNDGTVIPGGLTGSAWVSDTQGAQAIYGEGSSTVYHGSGDELANLSTYGRLYNWHAVNTGKLCPVDWHVASKAEWEALVTELGGAATAGVALRSTSWGGNNTVGFQALPAGTRANFDNGSFWELGNIAFWWTSDENPDNTSQATNARINVSNGSVEIYSHDGKGYGASVRCIHD